MGGDVGDDDDDGLARLGWKDSGKRGEEPMCM